MLSDRRYKFGESTHGDVHARRPGFGSEEVRARVRSALKRKGRSAYAENVLSRRALIAAVTVVCFGAGFYAGNRRASALERYLDQVVLENDGLRAVMSEQSYHLDRLADSRGGDDEIARLRTQLDQSMLSLADARSAADAKGRDIEARDTALADKELALRECGSVQVKLEEQLEACVFDKAALERSAARAARNAEDEARPRSGVSAVSETVTYPTASPDRHP
jgi:hypothetical protein